MTQGAGEHIQKSQQTGNAVSEGTDMLSPVLWRSRRKEKKRKNDLMALFAFSGLFHPNMGGKTLLLNLG